MLLPGLLPSPVNIVGGGRKEISPGPGSARQLISRGSGKCQSLPVTVCGLDFKTLQFWDNLINSPSGLRSPCGVEMRCGERWIPTWELPLLCPVLIPGCPARCPSVLQGHTKAVEARHNWDNWHCQALCQPYISKYISLSPFPHGETEAQRDFCKLYKLTET